MRISERFKGREAYNAGGKPCPVVLNANESFIRPSEELMEEFHTILANCEFNRYPDGRSTELCKAFGELYGVNWEYVTAGDGSDELISLLFACLVAPHDRVVTVNPDFSMYGAGAYMHDVEEIVYQTENYTINVDALLSLCKEKDAAMLIFSNPCNPTGVVLPREDVLRIVDEFDGIVVVDEAYMDFSDQSVMDLAGTKENLIVLRTCSKAIGMAGLRVGFAVTTPLMTNYLQAGKPVFNVGRLTGELAMAVLRRKDEIASAISAINKSTRALEAGINALAEKYDAIERVLPSATNFVYVVSDKAPELFERMQDHGVLVRMPSKDALRINCGTDEENDACLVALEKSLKEACAQ